MRTIRRLTVEIGRQTISLSGNQAEKHQEAASLAGKPHAKPAPEHCPVCGALLIPVRELLPSSVQTPLSELQQLLAEMDIHLNQSPSGEIFVCQNGFEEERSSS